MAIIIGTTGDNNITGSNGSDIITGLGGNDTLNGGGGSDIIDGGSGNDIIDGGAGNDILFGGDGNDTIIGGTGDDIMSGGRGADLFIFSSNSNKDTIIDFQLGLDHLQFNGVNLNSITLSQNILGTTLKYGISSVTLLGVYNVHLSDLLQSTNHPPQITNQTFSIAENNAVGQAVGTVTATDQEGGALTYAIVGGSSLFSINASTGTLTATSSFNYETQSNYSLQIQVTDNTGLKSQALITINVANANESPTDVSLSNHFVNENAANGTVVGTLSALDPDLGDSVSFTLLDNAGGLFAISGNQLIVTGSLDYETSSSHSITVHAQDAGGLSFDKTFTINVNNLNEAPTDITLSHNSVNENSAVGTVIGTFSAFDPDLADTATFSLLDNAGGLFSISGNQLIVSAPLDYETSTSHSILVHVVDSGGLSFNKAFTIQVNDVLEATALFSGNNDSIDFNHILASSYIAGTQYDALAGNDVVTLPDIANAAAAGYDLNATFFGNDGNDTIMGGDGNDHIVGGMGQDTIYGGAGNDYLEGDLVHPGTLGDADIIYGGDGNDTIMGKGGDDQLYGGAGYDYLVGDAGNNYIDGGADTDIVTYINLVATGVNVNLANNIAISSDINSGTDTLVNIENVQGSNFADIITGDNGSNMLLGEAGDDQIFGLDGNDYIVGGSGNDALTGGAGADTFYFDATGTGVNPGTDLIRDFQVNQDILYLDGANPNLTFSQVGAVDSVNGSSIVSALQIIYIDGAGATHAVLLAGVSAAQFAQINIQGLASNQFLNGDDGDNTLIGGNGNDILNGFGGNDTLIGGSGSDQFFGDDFTANAPGGNDVMTGGLGADVYIYNTDNNTGNDIITDFAVGIDRIILSTLPTVATSNDANNDFVLAWDHGSITLQGVHTVADVSVLFG